MTTKTIFLTTKFKIHSPTRRKREILDDALYEYTKGYESLLDYAEPRLGSIVENCLYHKQVSEKQLSTVMYNQKEQLSALKLPGCLREGLCRDVASSLVSYIEQGDGAGFPTCRDWRSGGGWEEALGDLSNSAYDHEEEQELYSEVSRRQYWKSQYMPLLFARSRDFDVVRKLDTKHLYAVLPLLSSRDERCERMDGEPLIDVWTGEIIETRSKIRVVFPLEVSRKNKEWHTRLLEHNCNPKIARLVKDGDEYYLCVTVAQEVEILEPETILGIDRGVNDLFSARVIGYDGNVLAEYAFDNRGFIEYQKEEWLRRKDDQKKGRDITGHKVRNKNEELAHIAANAIVGLAQEHKSQVVTENLKGLDKKMDRFYALRATNYTRAGQILDYKLPLGGLPKPRSICAAYTSQRCSKCGHTDRESRYDGDYSTFKCTECGYEDNADLNAATNIANRFYSIKVKGECEVAKHCANRTIKKGKDVKCSFAKEAVSDAE